MNYQFIRSELGVPMAQFEMGAEAFTRWFSEDLGTQTQKIDALCEAIKKLEQGKIKEFHSQGPEFQLLMDCDEVEIRATSLNVEDPNDLPEGTEYYDQEGLSGCGLEDFKQVLYSWREFVISQ